MVRYGMMVRWINWDVKTVTRALSESVLGWTVPNQPLQTGYANTVMPLVRGRTDFLQAFGARLTWSLCSREAEEYFPHLRLQWEPPIAAALSACPVAERARTAQARDLWPLALRNS
jgi:hypothetical protein